MNRYWYQPLPLIEKLGRTPLTRLTTLAAGNIADQLHCSLIINVENAPRCRTPGAGTHLVVQWQAIAIIITLNLEDALYSLAR